MKTTIPTAKALEKAEKWYLIDATGKTLGRVATLVAMVLRGKNKPTFTPHLVCGDHVIIVNASQVKVTGRKMEQKVYYRHTEFPGGIKKETLRQVIETKPEKALETAIKGMLPKNHMGRVLMTRLRVYPEAAHPHAAQKPEPLNVPGRE